MTLFPSEDDYDGNDDEVWIKGFQKGKTKIRWVERIGAFKRYQEHYADGVGAFPCSHRRDCPGCNDDNERVRRRPKRWAANALNAKGQLGVYKIGKDLKIKFEADEQNFGPITDRDYEILRTGEGLDTDYDRERLDVYAVRPPDELHDVVQILMDKLTEAYRAYGLTVPDDFESTDPAPAAAHDEAPLEPDQEDPNLPVEDWNAARLRTFLDEKKVEFPPRAARSVLINLAKEVLAKVPF